jgi:hypothetical protein
MGPSFGQSLNQSSVRGATRYFLVNKLHAKGYLPPLAEQGTKAFHVAVHQLPIDLQVLKSFLETALAASLDRYIDDRFFARICISWKLILVAQKCFKP